MSKIFIISKFFEKINKWLILISIKIKNKSMKWSKFIAFTKNKRNIFDFQSKNFIRQTNESFKKLEFYSIFSLKNKSVIFARKFQNLHIIVFIICYFFRQISQFSMQIYRNTKTKTSKYLSKFTTKIQSKSMNKQIDFQNNFWNNF